VINTHFIGSYLLMKYGTEEQRDRWLPRMATGEIRAAFSLSEPELGSDVAAIKTSAKKVDDTHYEINGQKMWVTNGLRSALVFTLVKTNPDAEKAHQGMTCFIAEKEPGASENTGAWKGLSVPPKIKKMGYKGVEFAGGYPSQDAKEVRKLLDDNGLKCCGSHIPLATLQGDNLEKTIEFNKTIGTVDNHVHSIPVLLGAKYYVMPDHQGLFGAMELGMFDLMQGDSTGGSANEVKFGGGIGAGWQMKQWNARVNLHSQDFGNFGDRMMISAGVGYQFIGL